MERPGLKIVRLNGGLGRRGTTNDMTTAVVMNAIATADMILGTIYTLISIDDVEALGLSAAYDDDNNVLVYHRLKRLFVRNPSVTIHFMPLAQTVTMTQMADKANDHLAKLLRDKAGEVVIAIICLNPVVGYVPTIVTGLDSDSISAIYKLQELATAEFEKDRYCEFFVEGRSFSGTASAALNLRTLVDECADVSVVIMADNDVSNLKTIYNKYAAVEDFTAIVSLSEVSQNAGELIQDFNLTNVAQGFFLNAGLSSGNHINTFNDASLDLLNEKGYVFAGATPGIAGYHIVDTSTCAKITSDYAYVENNRTIKKAIKLARKAILPRVKSRIYVDSVSGKIKAENAKEIEMITTESLRPMLTAGDISGGIDAFVDPNQNILATSRLDILLTFVPVSIGRQITLKIGFKNPLKS